MIQPLPCVSSLPGMELKDYYQVLGLQPGATLTEIKKAYRQLALQYHPDKNNNDPYAASRFAEIKEAYETLSHPHKKEYYLQQRWYNQSAGKKFSGNEPLTPPSLLKQCLELDRYISFTDINRPDREGLKMYIASLIDDTAIDTVNRFKEWDVNKQIIITLLHTTTLLKYAQLEEVATQLFKLCPDDTESKQLITAALEKQRQKEKLGKYQPFFIIALTIFICLLIYLAGR